jgi:hypothetical protein
MKSPFPSEKILSFFGAAARTDAIRCVADTGAGLFAAGRFACCFAILLNDELLIII